MRENVREYFVNYFEINLLSHLFFVFWSQPFLPGPVNSPVEPLGSEFRGSKVRGEGIDGNSLVVPNSPENRGSGEVLVNEIGQVRDDLHVVFLCIRPVFVGHVIP